MYTQEQIAALAAENFDFDNFDWEAARDFLCWHQSASSHRTVTVIARVDAAGPLELSMPEGLLAYGDVRALHVAWSLAKSLHGTRMAAKRGETREVRKVVGPHGCEDVRTQQPMTAARVKYAIAAYKLHEVSVKTVLWTKQVAA